MPLHGLSAHRQRGEGRGGKGGGISHGDHHHQDRNASSASASAGSEDPRLITGTATYLDDIKMPGMHHAVHRAQPARRGEDQGHRHARPRSRCPAWSPCSPARTSRISGRSPAARRCPACACRTITSWRRTACTSSAIPSPWWSRPTATSRATPRTWSKWTTSRCRPWPIRRRRSRRALPPVHPRVARQRRVHLPPGRRRHRARRSREAEVVVKQRITSQRLIPTADGDARRGGGMAAGREVDDAVLVHPDPAPDAHDGGGHPGHAGEPAARDHAGGRRRLRVAS